MVVYIPELSGKPSHVIFICPASDMRKADCPSDWLEDNGKPRHFEVEFQFGKAEVPSNIADYLIRQGFAKRSMLIIPPNKVLNASGV